jgi:hypothetical protein
MLILLLFCTRSSIKATERLVGEFARWFFLLPLGILQIKRLRNEPLDVVQSDLTDCGDWPKKIFILGILCHHERDYNSHRLCKGGRNIIIKSLESFIVIDKGRDSISFLWRKIRWIPCLCWNIGPRRLLLIFWSVWFHISKKYKLIIIKQYISHY